ncbi:hypothetical protein CcaverHIS002_0402370 [Cutaneotrichosporon cavernicola]|uniref:Uncharacterized protein n=1 Tax=Cutaneotrichosporon cavernicola TaxID=279322 RepID=A0AA48L3Q9_9TREE|nr:uncharacterized protein CcaverHIS019_0402340 [Cutaneotrichosporon cavernicola]BEI83633.1 hypothetical protein CcaverHIS002_0402370 [Cutaneotrichosporon cavernicola]BEI91414.1 hypothetical protein CcaverHIS019_0402340 [Cutaneotrichosporon cavernicola]BEJ06964.1 hypothetical protein CcaverHIS641_0402330 [Cutaneotrichosporon cavernicola]
MTRARTTRKRSPAASISSMSSVDTPTMHISPPITRPITPPFFGNDVDLTLDISRFEPHRPAPSPFKSGTATPTHAPPVNPPRSPDLFSRTFSQRVATPRSESYAKSRRASDESETETVRWRAQMVDVAMSYATLASANPRDFVATTTAQAHHNVVLRRLSDPSTTELEALAILRGYIDQVHSSSRGRGHQRTPSADLS